MLSTPQGEFALFVGHMENTSNTGGFPFEVWVNGADQPRGLGAVAKTLSMDMRTNDRGWLKLKLETLSRTIGEKSFEMAMPPHGEKKLLPGAVAAFAQVVNYRCEKLGALDVDGPTPVLDSLFSLHRITSYNVCYTKLLRSGWMMVVC